MSNNLYIHQALNYLRSFDRNNSKKPLFGGECIYNIKKLSQFAYLHKIIPPLTEMQIFKMETNIRRKIPKDLQELYRITNGLRTFSESFCIAGYVELFARDNDEIIQPTRLQTPNTHEQPKNAPPDAVFFGFYQEDASKTYIIPDGKIYRCARWDATPVNEWKNLEEFLLPEFKRLSQFFDEDMIPLNHTVKKIIYKGKKIDFISGCALPPEPILSSAKPI